MKNYSNMIKMADCNLRNSCNIKNLQHVLYLELFFVKTINPKDVYLCKKPKPKTLPSKFSLHTKLIIWRIYCNICIFFLHFLQNFLLYRNKSKQLNHHLCNQWPLVIYFYFKNKKYENFSPLFCLCIALLKVVIVVSLSHCYY